MLYRLHRPAPPLNAFVDHCWLVRASDYPHAREWIFPEGAVDLMFNLGPSPHAVVDAATGRVQPYRRAWVSGARQRSILVETAAHGYDLVGVHFRPGGAYPFLGLPQAELQDRVVELDDLWGNTVEAMREEMAEARSPERIFPAVERMLLRRAGNALRVDPVVAAAIESLARAGPGHSIAGVARELGIAHRRLIATFDRAVGLKPKALQRVLRFQRVIRAEAARPALDWAPLATECGYFDQAHLIRDFRIFAGMTPEAYRARREYPNNVPVDREPRVA